jgi:hypothetical protein
VISNFNAFCAANLTRWRHFKPHRRTHPPKSALRLQPQRPPQPPASAVQLSIADEPRRPTGSG